MATAFLAQDVLASCLQIAGTFLLAVEAIKLSNLRKFRDTVFGTPRRLLTPYVSVPKSASPAEEASAIDRRRTQLFLLLGAVGLVFLIFVGWVLKVSPEQLWASVRSAFPGASHGAILAILTIVCFSIFLSLIVGFLLYKALYLPFDIPFRALELIEAKTASGGIGILGFLLFLVGSLVHIWLKFAA